MFRLTAIIPRGRDPRRVGAGLVLFPDPSLRASPCPAATLGIAASVG